VARQNGAMKSRLIVAGIALNAVAFVVAWYVILAPGFRFEARGLALAVTVLDFRLNRLLLSEYVKYRQASDAAQPDPPGLN
jgi:hypothetical protein